MRRKVLRWLGIVVWMGIGLPVSGEQAWFIGLGDLPGGERYSNAMGVSADHRVVIGFGTFGTDISNDREAFIWTREEGMVGLGFPDIPGGDFSMAEGVSADGTVVVGRAGWNTVDHRPFRWTREDGIVLLQGENGEEYYGTARSVSADGTVIVGTRIPNGPSDYWLEAFRWTPETDMVGLGDLGGWPGEKWSEGSDLSEDGTIVVGRVRIPGTDDYGMFSWTPGSGMVGLGRAAPGSPFTLATAVSRDGEIVVGYFNAERTGPVRAFRWSSPSGFEPLWTPPSEGFVSSGSIDVSGDGSTIVGQYAEGGGTDFRAFVWDAVNGRRDLQDLLVEDYGLGDALTGWSLDQANAISSDGMLIVGRGRNPLGYMEAFATYLGDPVVEADVPVIVAQPISQASEFGNSVTFEVDVAAAVGPGLIYQWKLNGTDIPGATGAALTLPMIQRFQTGQYTVEVMNGPHTVVSQGAMLNAEAPPASGARLLNLSTRAFLPTKDSLSIPGFVIVGSGTKQLLIRGVSASLRLPPFNLDSALGDPWLMVGTVERFGEGGVFTSIERNDDLETSENRAAILEVSERVGAFPITDERDGAILVDLPSGAYTAWVSSGGGEHPIGETLAEIYDADEGEPTAGLANISTRGRIGVGGSVLIPGFVISGEGPLTLLVRVVGPTLASSPFELPDAVPDPNLSLYSSGSDSLLFSNEDWGQQPDAAYTAEVAGRVGAFALDDGGKDAAIVLTLQPGAYTAVGSTSDGMNTGLALVEIYVVPPEIAQ